jgi:hypothetical protein
MLLDIAKCGEEFERIILGKCGKKSYGNLWHVGHEIKQSLRVALTKEEQ